MTGVTQHLRDPRGNPGGMAFACGIENQDT